MADIPGRGTSLTELIENKPGRNWTYNILTNTYTPPKGTSSTRGSAGGSKTPNNVPKEKIYLNVGGKVVEAQGSGGNYAKYSLTGPESKTKDNVGNYLRSKGHDISEVGKKIQLFKDPEQARASAQAVAKPGAPQLPREGDSQTGLKAPQTNNKGVNYVMVPELNRAITAADVGKLTDSELKALAGAVMGQKYTGELGELERQMLEEHISGKKKRRGDSILTTR